MNLFCELLLFSCCTFAIRSEEWKKAHSRWKTNSGEGGSEETERESARQLDIRQIESHTLRKLSENKL